jgi:hypothetical protein
MRKTGLSPKSPKKGDIPFGVRALQSGIEVDGIWVSRPGTPSRNSSKSKVGVVSALTIIVDEDGKTKTKVISGDKKRSANPGRPVPYRTQSSALVREPSSGSDTTDAQSTLSMPLPQISEDSTVPRRYQHRAGRLNEEALRRLDGQALRSPHLNTYMPTSHLSSPHSSVSRSHYRPSNRSSVSSSESLSSGGASRNPSSSSSQKSFPPVAREKDTHATQGPSRSPVRSSTATTSTWGTSATTESHTPLMTSPVSIQKPQPTFGPHDSYANRQRRQINEGFEVLPAGTFSTPHASSKNMGTHSQGV